ncbi:MAG: YggS family pyridoxal phosphate-dependent enzyme [Planctomycetaceae bacterium]|jgi:pyridoxal phosphate enzyme (YggS family)|nr:YggS family pyridoxal phosphate-dependent enzyme [Planctomycetaceae bacterium]
MDTFRQIADNVSTVWTKISDAVIRSGRTSDSVTLVAVSKYVKKDDDAMNALLAAKCYDLGESRPQMLIEKAEYFSEHQSKIHWHQIGSLQKNKVRKLLPHVSLIHSIGSTELLETINRIANEEALPPVHGLLEINISGDATKQGFSPQMVIEVLETVSKLRHIQIDGLMCMSGFSSTDDKRCKEFAATRQLAEKLIPFCPDNCRMAELSMGMSDDFPLAIQEGATIVRVGSLLFDNVILGI